MSGLSKAAAPLSHDEAKLLCSLLDRMNTAGRVPGDEDELQSLGAMSDSSKRLPSTSEDAGFEGYEHLGTPRAKQSQLPLAPGSETGVKLPPGISDLKDWGTTISKLPKVAVPSCPMKSWSKIPRTIMST